MTTDTKSRAETGSSEKALNAPKSFSHGTLECHDLAASRKFYEEFLGLETVRHAPVAMLLRFPGNDWAVVCMGVGDKAQGNKILNHWGLDMNSREEVTEAHARAEKYKDAFGIQKITKPLDTHGNYQFYILDLDGNWWEFQYVPEGMSYDEKFERGDQFPK